MLSLVVDRDGFSGPSMWFAFLYLLTVVFGLNQEGLTLVAVLLILMSKFVTTTIECTERLRRFTSASLAGSSISLWADGARPHVHGMLGFQMLPRRHPIASRTTSSIGARSVARAGLRLWTALIRRPLRVLPSRWRWAMVRQMRAHLSLSSVGSWPLSQEIALPNTLFTTSCISRLLKIMGTASGGSREAVL